MILILTCDGDMSADLVIDWLLAKNYPFIRVNSHRFINRDFYFDLEKGIVALEGQTIEIDQIKSVWFRKFGFFVDSDYYKEAKHKLNNVSLVLLEKEYYKVLSFFTNLFRDKFWLTNPNYMNINKVDVLMRAKNHDLCIPETYIVSNKTQLDKIRDLGVITKSIYDPIMITTATVEEHLHPVYMMYTSKIEEEDFQQLPDNFFPSLVQRCVDKTYEVRTFYLMGECYSMAIFSQLDATTSQDFRKYNWDKPNRTVPYKLPATIESKLHDLLLEIGLNCASIDFIKDIDGNYVFLEINPTGQFGMVDFPCNYGLHKKVAELLIENDN